jgi:hypothetical protein
MKKMNVNQDLVMDQTWESVLQLNLFMKSYMMIAGMKKTLWNIECVPYVIEPAREGHREGSLSEGPESL